MDNNEKVITIEGKKKLETELAYLEGDKRREVSERIKEARAFGDLSENSEYDDAKNEQALVEKRISEIHETLVNAKVVRAIKKSSGEIGIGSEVKVNMAGTERLFSIVGGAESDIASGKLSNASPVGSALMGHKKGEEVEAEGPTGKSINIKILNVK